MMLPSVRLAPGQVIRIDNRHIVSAALDSVELIVNVPQRMLFHRSAEGVTVGYPVAVGRPSWPTPSGAFVVEVLERAGGGHERLGQRAEHVPGEARLQRHELSLGQQRVFGVAAVEGTAHAAHDGCDGRARRSSTRRRW
jgi:hypothetical protein